MTQFDQITQWIRDAGQEPGSESVWLYAALCVEETAEMMDAVGMPTHAEWLAHISERMRSYELAGRHSRPAMLDAACDLIWVATGLIHSMGIDPNEAMARVIASNDSKRQADGSLAKDDTGKVIKPEGYQPPDWEGLL